MGLLDDLFGSKKQTTSVTEMMPSWQLQTGNQLSDWIQQYLKQYAPGEGYGGQFVAEKTPYESQGLGILQNYLNAPATGDLFGAAKGQLMDTLSGKYMNPDTSPYIQAMQRLGQSNLEDQISQERAQRGGAGQFFHSARVAQEGNMRTDTMNNLNSIIGNYLQTERGNMLNAVPQAMNAEAYAQNAPLEQVKASQSYGSLDRILNQANLEAQYNDWLSGRKELSTLPSSAQGLYSTKVDYGLKDYTTTTPSTFLKMMGEVSPLVGSYNTGKYGYNTNQASLSKALESIMKMIPGIGQ